MHYLLEDMEVEDELADFLLHPLDLLALERIVIPGLGPERVLRAEEKRFLPILDFADR